MVDGIAMLAVDCDATRIVHRAIVRRFGHVDLLIEERRRRSEVARRRVRTQGVVPVIGQSLFQLLIVPVLERRSRDRIQEILASHSLDVAGLPSGAVRVPSINSEAARQWLRERAPRVVVLSGTRIASLETLRSTPAVFLNMHAGITPHYRGVHGGYWALADKRPDLAGTTIHVVDEGIDTGPVIAQSPLAVTERDDFATYPYLHIAAGLPHLLDAVGAACRGEISPRPRERKVSGQLRTHPTAWGYVWRRWRMGVR